MGGSVDHEARGSPISYEVEKWSKHVVLDSVMHRDIQPLSPFASGPAQVSESFTIDFIHASNLAAPSFAAKPLVEIEITAELPWIVREEKEPD